jgi:uncharacterized protein YutE (UPF0331/DUF86 family)
MVNPDVLHRRLEKLDEYLDYLESAQRYSFREFADDLERRGSVERFLHLSVEALTDMASHVVSDEDLGSVDRARDLPDRFAEAGYVDDELATTWKDMIGFRNVLVHEYLEIDPERVYDVLQNQLGDIRRLRRVFGHFL